MNEAIVIFLILILIVVLMMIKRRSKPTGGTKYTLIRTKGGSREVYNSDTGTWVLMALVLSDLDFDCSGSQFNEYTSAVDDHSSDMYDSGSSCDSGSDFE